MILYLGSSSLIKLYVEEQHSELISDWVRAAEIVATCRVAYTEIVSALSIRHEKGDITTPDHDRLLRIFNDDWPAFTKIDFDDVEAGNLIEKYGLTRFGALHLSAAKSILDEYEQLFDSIDSTKTKECSSPLTLFFSSTDERLCRAASDEGLKVISLN